MPSPLSGSSVPCGKYNRDRQVSPAYLDLNLVPLLSLLHLPVFVPQLSLLLLQLPPRDLPEGVDLVPLQLEVVTFLAFPVQLLTDAADMLFHLPSRTKP